MDDKMVEWLFRNPISDGGQFTGISDVIGKYGVVPSSVMPETYSSENTSQIARLVGLKLREFGLQLRDEAAKGVKVSALEANQDRNAFYRLSYACLSIR